MPGCAFDGEFKAGLVATWLGAKADGTWAVANMATGIEKGSRAGDAAETAAAAKEVVATAGEDEKDDALALRDWGDCGC